MRMLLFFALAGLPLAAPAIASDASAATIKGQMTVNGLACRGVKLIPRTLESEREIAAMFGTTDRAVSAEAKMGRDAPPAVSGKSLGIDVRCSGWTQGFSFRNVAPGDYFVTALGSSGTSLYTPSAEEELNYRQPKRRDVYFMRPVRVTAADRTVDITFTLE